LNYFSLNCHLFFYSVRARAEQDRFSAPAEGDSDASSVVSMARATPQPLLPESHDVIAQVEPPPAAARSAVRGSRAGSRGSAASRDDTSQAVGRGEARHSRRGGASASSHAASAAALELKDKGGEEEKIEINDNGESESVSFKRTLV